MHQLGWLSSIMLRQENLKRSHTVGFHLCNILKIKVERGGDHFSACQVLGREGLWGVGVTVKG